LSRNNRVNKAATAAGVVGKGEAITAVGAAIGDVVGEDAEAEGVGGAGGHEQGLVLGRV
jgi:hypothetical protein